MSLIRTFRTMVIAGVCCVACSSWASPASAETPAAAVTSNQNTSPVAIVDAQLAAYNRRDLDGFLGFYADDAVLAKHPDQITQTGKAEMRARYQRNFSNPNVRAEIIERVAFGRFVIDHERVVAPPAKGELEAVAVYEIKDGKIVRVTFLEK